MHQKPKLILIIFSLFLMAVCQTEECSEPNYIIPFEPLDDAFDTGIDAVRSQ